MSVGDAHGSGNRFGVAAAYGVFVLPVIFCRIFVPPTGTVPYIMFNVSDTMNSVLIAILIFYSRQSTLALVVGYSWLDGHLPMIGNPGKGWNVAWKRWVLVVIGKVSLLRIYISCNNNFR